MIEAALIGGCWGFIAWFAMNAFVALMGDDTKASARAAMWFTLLGAAIGVVAHA